MPVRCKYGRYNTIIPQFHLVYLSQVMTTRLHLGSIRKGIRPHDIRRYFQYYGPVVDVTINPNRVGFVEFADQFDADAALRKRKHFIAGSKLTCKLSHNKEVREFCFVYKPLKKRNSALI